jgi:hypothetical protein
MQRSPYFISVVVIVTILAGALVFVSQTRAYSDQQLAAQTTAITTQVWATSAALRSTAQAHLEETAAIAVNGAVQQTTTVEYGLQGTQIAQQLRSTQQSELSAHDARIFATQIMVQATDMARDQMIHQTQVANAVRQTVLAIPTATPAPTSTPIPTATPIKPKVNVLMEGCTTGLDAIRRRIGEVTNAYVTLVNVGETDVSGVVVTLKASDKASEHPDQYEYIQYLPVDHKVTVSLTAGTNILDDSGIEVIVTTIEGAFEQTSRSDCKEIDPATLDSFARVLRLVIPIPRLPIGR